MKNFETFLEKVFNTKSVDELLEMKENRANEIKTCNVDSLKSRYQVSLEIMDKVLLSKLERIA